MGRRRRRRRYREEYDDDDYSYPRNIFKDFFISLLWILVGGAFVVLLIIIGLHFAAFVAVLYYTFWIGLLLAGLGLLYLIVRICSAASLKIAETRKAHASARYENFVASQQRERVRDMEMERYLKTRKLAFQEHRETRLLEQQAMYQQQNLLPRTTRKIEALPELEDLEYGEGGPKQQEIYFYKDYAHHIKKGELIVGIQRDGQIRIGTWDEFKVLLVLGSSSSGKTCTMAEKILAFVVAGGRIILCDPHGHKQDSLLRKITTLYPAHLPGTKFAIEHKDILHNVRLVRSKLEERVGGADCREPVMLVIEELGRLQRDEEIAKEIRLTLEAIGQEGRGYNVFAMVGAQTITQLAKLRKSFISYIVHRVDESESKLCIPARFAKNTSELGTGHTYVKDADGVTDELQQVLVTAEDIKHVADTLFSHQSRPPKALPVPSQQSAPQIQRRSRYRPVSERGVIEIPEEGQPGPQPTSEIVALSSPRSTQRRRDTASPRQKNLHQRETEDLQARQEKNELFLPSFPLFPSEGSQAHIPGNMSVEPPREKESQISIGMSKMDFLDALHQQQKR